MHKLTRQIRVNDRRVLDHLASLYPEVQLNKSQIRTTQLQYYGSSRDPRVLQPTTGIPPASTEVLKVLYAAARAGDKLDWIKRFREGHALHYCPMCGGTGVSDLDHVLPRANYPELAWFSYNLVPTCVPCNRRRSNKGAKFHLLHPYFDHKLLSALSLRVEFLAPFDAVRFRLKIDGLTHADLQRAHYHVKETLPILVFRRHMRTEWDEWHRRFARRGARAASLLTDELLDVRSDNQNSWRSAFLRGLQADAAATHWMLTTPLG
jgi:5-methylcytosine-specific restriction endonuclease McrA